MHREFSKQTNSKNAHKIHIYKFEWVGSWEWRCFIWCVNMDGMRRRWLGGRAGGKIDQFEATYLRISERVARVRHIRIDKETRVAGIIVSDRTSAEEIILRSHFIALKLELSAKCGDKFCETFQQLTSNECMPSYLRMTCAEIEWQCRRLCAAHRSQLVVCRTETYCHQLSAVGCVCDGMRLASI